MRICIDLDGAIASLREEGQSYEDVKPVPGAIEKLKELKRNGHYIMIQTARHMKTCNGNQPLILARIGKITLDWLDKYKIPFDEISFGKPWADVYIDDNAFRFKKWSDIAGDGLNLPISQEKKMKQKTSTEKINFVIAMAGKGKRFIDAGYITPKPLIKAKGKTLLQWGVDSLPLDMCDKLIFVGLEEHERDYNISGKIKEWYGDKADLKFIFLSEVTGGQAETVLKAKPFLDPEKPLLIYNIDTYFDSKSLRENLKKEEVSVLGAFKADSDKFSFAKLNEKDYVIEVAEKIPISSNALTGLYHFAKAKDFIQVAEEHIKNDKKTKGEFYVAPMYNDLIKKEKKFILDFCDKHYIFGTPEQLRDFENEG